MVDKWLKFFKFYKKDKAIKRFSVKDIVDGSSKRDIGESKAFDGYYTLNNFISIIIFYKYLNFKCSLSLNCILNCNTACHAQFITES